MPDERGNGSRFAELTYTSFDAVASPGQASFGGWQVKETRGGLSEPETEYLCSQVSTQLDTGVDVPAFPTDDEILALPRRLVYGLAGEGRTALWHTAPAGVDGSGRPGNVFAHVVLDRSPGEPGPQARPIDLWRSPDWLTPYNADGVLAATLGPTSPPRPGASVTRQSVVEFVLDPNLWRVGLLVALLDAVAGALEGGPRVVLGVDDVEAAALWVGSVSHLMSATTSRSLYFSTLERAGGGLQTAWSRGIHLACVPRADLPGLRRAPDILVLDEHEVVTMGALGGEPHVTEGGARITVTPWSVLAQVVLQEGEVATRALHAMDEVAETVGDWGLRHDWPLAMAALRLPELADDARHESAVVVAGFTPDRLEGHPEILRLALDAVRILVGGETAKTWGHVLPSGASPRPILQRLIVQIYVDQALTDTRWLAQVGGVPLPSDSAEIEYEGAFAAAATTVELLEDWADHAPGLDDRRAVAVLAFRITDVLFRLGLLATWSEPAAALLPRLRELTRRLAVPILLDPHEGQALLMSVAPVAPEVVETLAQDAVAREVAEARARGEGRLGERVPAGLAGLGWATEWRGVPLETMLGRRTDTNALDAELAAMVADGKLEGSAEHAALGLVAALHDRSVGLAVAVDVAGAFERVRPGPFELTLLVEAFGDAVPLEPLVEVVAGAAWDNDLRLLCDAIRQTARGPAQITSSSGPQVLATLVELRVLLDRYAAGALEKAVLRPMSDRVVTLVDSLVADPARPIDHLFADDLVAQIRTAVVASVLLRTSAVGPDGAGWRRVLTRPLRADVLARQASLLAEMIGAGVLNQVSAAAALVSAAPRFPAQELVSTQALALALMPSPAGSSTDSLLEESLKQSAASRPFDPTDLAARVGDWVAVEYERRGRSDREIDDVSYRCERFAESRLKQLTPRGGGRLNGAIARFRRT